jgi:two-component system sensor histidine kinase HydH
MTQQSVHTRPFHIRPSMLPRHIVFSSFLPHSLENIWQSVGLSTADIVTFSLIFTCLGLMVYHTNKEYKKADKQTKQSRKRVEDARLDFEKSMSTKTLEEIAARRAHADELERVAKFGELSKGLFHDLINPLSTVSLSIERLAAKETSPAEAEELIQTAIAASRRMGSFMESMRSAMGDRLQENTAHRSHISTELSTIFDLVAYKARMANVRIIIDSGNMQEIRLHPIRLQQLLLNLISNSIEACERVDTDQEKLVIVRGKADSSQGYISVTDTGCGIAPEHTALLFTDYFSTKPHGTGIGLRTVKTIVEHELNGSITITNVPTGGTLCEISFPLKNS